MHMLRVAVPVILTVSMFGQAPIVRREAIWVETVKRGDMPVSARGQGTISSKKTAELQIPQSLAKHVQPGQAVSVDTRPALVKGKVSRVGPKVIDGMVPVAVNLEETLPESAPAGAAVVGTIHISTLNNVAYVGRPVSCQPDGEGALFKVEPGGQAATRVKVRYGQFGHAPTAVVQIRDGLQAGDQVILSDMSEHQGRERVRLE